MTTQDERAARWSRRQALRALAAAGIAPGLATALPAAPGLPDDALRAYARSVGATPEVAEIGHAAANGRDTDALETALRERIPGSRDEAGWRTGLLDAARADIAAGAWVEADDRRLTRIEADFLGFAAQLQLSV